MPETSESIKTLLASETLAVLATHHQGQPHVSLVAFAATADGHELIFATTRSSRKFANLQQDSRAAILIDSRRHNPADFHQARALSATGTATEVSGTERQSRLRLFLTKHPYLREFVESPSCALMKVEVQEYNLVSKFQKVIKYRPAS
jgi:nitroimidazol reductase NimA-like FMN-containing flavoprotein (pyridoxamine 5'-phosphate oxidase superfamily)